MRTILVFLWLAGFVQVAIASANLFIPKKLNYRENLSRVAPIIRQIFVVHSVYIPSDLRRNLRAGGGSADFLPQRWPFSGYAARRFSFCTTTHPCGKRTVQET